jgi:hypothetical protein
VFYDRGAPPGINGIFSNGFNDPADILVNPGRVGIFLSSQKMKRLILISASPNKRSKY